MKSASSFTLIVVFVCLSLIGAALIPLLPVKLNPSRTLPGFSVHFTMPGASSRVVETEVTSKLEAMLSRIRGVQDLSSTSKNGSGNITVKLDKHANPDVVRFEASTVIRQTWSELPNGVNYPIIQMKVPDEKASRPFISFTLNAPVAPILIQQYAEEHIKPHLSRLPGVYKIELRGASPMEWQLKYDGKQLQHLGITIQDISNAVQRHHQKDFLGIHNVEDHKGGAQWMRLVLAPESSGEQFEPSAISVGTINGKIVRLNELVTVSHVEEEPQSYFRINGLNSIYLSITANETANQLQLSNRIMQEMEYIKATLPAGYEVHTSYDATEYIRSELEKIYFRTGLTVLILLLFVWLITRRLKYLFLILASLTVNIAVAVIFYYLFDLEIQLYSLAGITVSLNLVIDNTIVMTDHLLHRRNLKAFLSILAATLTTIGALVIIFFLNEQIRVNLQDFAAVVIINLVVSLAVALFFVPSMVDKLKLTNKKRKKKPLLLRRLPIYFTRVYAALISVFCRWRWAVWLFLILGFGLPVFLLPEKLEGEGKWKEFYNKTFGSTTYKESVKPVVDKFFGGSLRLFIQEVYTGSYFNNQQEVVLTVAANLPSGSTLEQMNTLVKRMETFLSDFKEIKQFHTSIASANQATINIYFKKEYLHTGFPYALKSHIIYKVTQLGGGSWGVYGLPDIPFNNDVREMAGSYHILMYGYNYDELYAQAERLKAKLLTNPRIKEIFVMSDFSWFKDDYKEFYFDLDKERTTQEGFDARTLVAGMTPIFGRDMTIGTLSTEKGTERIKLSSRQSQEYDFWSLQFFPYKTGEKQYKLSGLATMEKCQMPQEIAKENQQYRLCLQYEFVGTKALGEKVLRKELKNFSQTLPMGYTAEEKSNSWQWRNKDNKQYLLLLVVITIIFFITSILFNSLRQPFAILFIIPVSYIGVFLTFYWFRLNFDQGGFASFILLCGITVNASIYILNEYNNIRKRYRHLSPLKAYLKAWNAKVVPIFLTVMSTILGFLPFMIGLQKEAFWYPLAAGTIGGLAMSFLGIFLFLPVFVLKKSETRQQTFGD